MIIAFAILFLVGFIAFTVLWLRISTIQYSAQFQYLEAYKHIEKLVAYEIADCLTSTDAFGIGAHQDSSMAKCGQVRQFTIVVGDNGEKFLLRNFKGKLTNLKPYKVKGVIKNGCLSPKTAKQLKNIRYYSKHEANNNSE